ncbi:MAG: hypothetical protein H6652_00205 [Ardenticatenaceae bacterium]|nr:hypothetical protein [Ardenticatenaceae bacterium]
MSTFDEQYPNIAWWVQDGWIEIGQDEYSRSFIRVLDIGGLVWESKESYETVAEALAEADAAFGRFADEEGL